MPITKQKKEEIVKELEEKFSDYKSIIFINYSGLDVASLENVRSELRKEGIDLRIVKKTLLDLVLRKLDIKIDIGQLTGQTAVVFGYKDEIMPSKEIYKFTKEFENLEILGGILYGQFIEPSKVVELARIPSYDELLGRMVGSMQAPLSGLVNVLNGNIRGLVQVLNAISQKS